MAVTTVISDLFSSIFHLLAAPFRAVWAIIAGITTSASNFVSAVIQLTNDIFAKVASIAEHLIKYFIANFAVLCVGAVVAFLFLQYSKSGKQVAARKKTN